MISNIPDYIQAMPKIELHCHLDGSLTPEFVKQAISSGKSVNELKQAMQAPENCASLGEYLTCFDLPIQALQSSSNITSAVLDVISQAAAHNVKYIEIRFAPTFSVHDNFSYNDVCEAAIKGTKLGLEQYGVYSNIILCAMRHLDYDTNLLTLNATREFLGSGICALDLAGDEALFPNENFINLFKEAKRLDVPFTIHSGECGSSNNVKLALELGAKRVGHGIALINDTNLMSECKKANLGLELCPTSNFQTKACTDINSYPLKDYLKAGMLATINTDNMTVSNTTLNSEYAFAVSSLGVDPKLLKTVYENSIRISFADDNVKHHLSKMSSAY